MTKAPDSNGAVKTDKGKTHKAMNHSKHRKRRQGREPRQGRQARQGRAAWPPSRQARRGEARAGQARIGRDDHG